MHGRGCGSLMAVKLADPFSGICGRKFCADPFRNGRKPGLARRNVPHGGQYLAGTIPGVELSDNLANAGQS
jgi:hypothetical protein